MRPCLPFVPLMVLLPLLAACNNVLPFGAMAIEQRRTMNDLQARATIAASCDISLGAYYRALSESERRYIALACAADGAPQAVILPPEPPPVAAVVTVPTAPVQAPAAAPQATSEPAPTPTALPEAAPIASVNAAPLVQDLASLPPPSGRDLLMNLDPQY